MLKINFNFVSLLIISSVYSLIEASNITKIISERIELDSKSSNPVYFNTTVSLDDKCFAFFIKMNYSLFDYSINDSFENNSLFNISRKGGIINYFRQKILLVFQKLRINMNISI